MSYTLLTAYTGQHGHQHVAYINSLGHEHTSITCHGHVLQAISAITDDWNPCPLLDIYVASYTKWLNSPQISVTLA